MRIGVWMPVKGGAHTLVDRETFEQVGHWRWKVDKHGYVNRNSRRDGKYVTVFLHRLVFGQAVARVDHRNREKIDNRRDNLRSMIIRLAPNE